MPWKPSEPGEFPTLGWLALEFITDLLAQPEAENYEPLVPTREQAKFILDLYRLDPATCRRLVTRAGLSRPRGWGKSPIVGAIGYFEALGNAVPDGWDADGQPVGKPWRTIRTPEVHLIGVSEDQTQNAWAPMVEMIRSDAPIWDVFPTLEPLENQINLPGRGMIRTITSSATTAKGKKPILALLDQTEEYTVSNGGIRLAETLINNATKRGGLVLETPNAFIPGRDTQAERTARAAELVISGRSSLKSGFLWDHREAPPETDLGDWDSLVAGLRFAYGCSSDHADGCVLHDPPCKPGWSPIEGTASRIWQPDADEQLMRADFLNQITHASDAFVSRPEWRGCKAPDKVVPPRSIVALGFDGSRGRAKGKPDATALIGYDITQKHLFTVRVWEVEDMPAKWKAWAPPIEEIEAEIEQCFRKYRVAKFYCDPGRDWRSYVNSWEAKYVGKLLKLTKPGAQQHPFEWWMTGGRSTLVERAVEQLYAAIANGDITHDNNPDLTRHILNARRRESGGKLALAKESSYSQKKMDAAIGAVLAFQGGLDALSGGIPVEKVPVRAPRQIY